MKWQDYLENVEFGGMTEADERDMLVNAIRKLAPVANKRIIRLEEAGFGDTYSLTALAEKGYQIQGRSTRGVFAIPNPRKRNKHKEVRIEKLRKEYGTLKAFLEYKTSTVKGAKEVKARFDKYVGTNIEAAINTKIKVGKNEDGSAHYTSLYWAAFHKAEELFKSSDIGWGSDDIRDFVDEYFMEKRSVRGKERQEVNKKTKKVETFQAINSTNKIGDMLQILQELRETGTNIQQFLEDRESSDELPF